MPFSDAAIYWRDASSDDGTTPDPSNLPASQFLAFNDIDRILTSITEGEQPNVSDDPAYDSGGDLVVEKQFNGIYGGSINLVIKTDATLTAFRASLRSFYRRVQIEPAHHEFGIFGIYHPVVTDFNIDPTDRYGLTMDEPKHTYIHGSEAVETRITFRLGGHIDEI